MTFSKYHLMRELPLSSHHMVRSIFFPYREGGHKVVLRITPIGLACISILVLVFSQSPCDYCSSNPVSSSVRRAA
jgi:hypothetical protein